MCADKEKKHFKTSNIKVGVLFLFFRDCMPRGTCARLLPGPAGIRHLPDDTHGLLGGVHRRLRHGGLLRQPENETPEIHLRVQRWDHLQRGGGKDHQVRVRGLHVAQSTQISCHCRRAEDGKKERRKEGKQARKEGKEREDSRKVRERRKERDYKEYI